MKTTEALVEEYLGLIQPDAKYNSHKMYNDNLIIHYTFPGEIKSDIISISILEYITFIFNKLSK